MKTAANTRRFCSIHRPSGWKHEQTYVVVRTQQEEKQKLLFPRYTFILVSRNDMALAEIVKRPRGKQGQEKAFKGPLIHLDLHHPPCGLFNANRAFYAAGQIAQILLVAMQMRCLPVEARVHGIRTLIRDLVRVAGKPVRHARKWKLLFAKSALRLHWNIACRCWPGIRLKSLLSWLKRRNREIMLPI